MTEKLKTLRDLKLKKYIQWSNAYVKDAPLSYEMVRDEAIKRIKAYRRWKKEAPDIKMDEEDWLYFFNITEEDLK